MKTNKKCDKKGRLAGNLKLLANENSRGASPGAGRDHAS